MTSDIHGLVLHGLLRVLPPHLRRFTERTLAASGLTGSQRALAAARHDSRPLDLADLSTQIRVLTARDANGRPLLSLPPGLVPKLHEVRHVRNDAVHGRPLDADRALAALVAVGETLRMIGADDQPRQEVRALIARLGGPGRVPSPLDAVVADLRCEPVVGYAHAAAGLELEVQVALSLPSRGAGDAGAQTDLGVVELSVVAVEHGNDRRVTAPGTLRWDTSADLAATLRLPLLADALLQVGADGPAELHVTLTDSRNRTQDRHLQVLGVWAPRSWQLRGGRRWTGAALATFVQPDQAALDRLVRTARRRAAGSTGPDAVARAACAAVRRLNLRLSAGAPAWADAPQPVRTAAELLDAGAGTPLDAAVLMAGLLERLELAAALLLTPGGVVVAYARNQDLPELAADDSAPDGLAALAERGDVGVIDPHLAASTRTALLHDLPDTARRRALEALEEAVLGVTLAQARACGATPQAELARQDDGLVVEVATAPGPAAESAPSGPEPQEATPTTGLPAAGPPAEPDTPGEVLGWKRGLLDLTLRNPLINRDSRTAVELQVPPHLLGRLEDLVNDRNNLVLEAADASQGEPADLLDQRRVRTALEDKEHQRRLASMEAQARTIVEETGANNLYLALGTLRWSSVGRALSSPLLLVPVTIVREEQTFGIRLDEAETSTPNFSLLERLAADTGVDLLELREPVRDSHGIDVAATLAAVGQRLARELPQAHVEETTHLGLFRFSTYRMWKDLEEHAPVLTAPAVAGRLALGGGGRPDAAPLPGPQDAVDLDALIEDLPLDADASQARVIADAVAGRNLVVEGPPGTGKSQTVANLIVAALGRGRTVMFVAEKAAALDVVARRLRQEVGLAGLLLNLHDNGMKPAQVCQCLREALEARPCGEDLGPADRAPALRERLAHLRAQLEYYRGALHGGGAGVAYYEAHEILLGARGPQRQSAHDLLEDTSRRTGLDGFDVQDHVRTVHEYRRTRDELRALLPREVTEAVTRRRDQVLEAAGQRWRDLDGELRRRRPSMSVRDLMSAYGDLVTAITPCLLVSPDSVARFLPADRAHVDLVVFDEASQITVAEAVGALGRGRSAVVVGDRRQMPPAPVAGARGGDLEGAPATGAESILERLVAAGVPQRRLTWHYRSRDESLIAFSNRHYYNGELATFPGPLALAPAADDGPGGHGISLRRVRGTYYPAGSRVRNPAIRPNTNPVEARQVVEEVIRRFELSPDSTPSIGVITLNARQRDLIEERLRNPGRRVRRVVRERILAALGQRDGLLVRNLDNVQGEERDTILLSLTFSGTDSGNVPLNFGSLSHEGGHRRLNVALTRARRQMVVFASFDPEQLRAELSAHQGLKDLRAYLEAARTGRAPRARERSRAEVSLYRVEIAERLREAGLEVSVGVGHSEFEIDLVLGTAGSRAAAGAQVAVLLDGPAWNRRQSVADRDLLPVDVLTSVGWPKVERVWLPQWVADPDAVVDHLVEAAGGQTRAAPAQEEPVEQTAPVRADARARAGGQAGPGAPGEASPREPEPQAPGPAEPTVYRAWRPEGTRSRDVLDRAATNEEARREVIEVAQAICDVEAPLTVHRLVVALCRTFNLSRTTSGREQKVRKVLGQAFAYVDEHDFVWRTRDSALAPVGYRRHALDHVDSIEEIHPRELVALMTHVRQTRPEWTSPEDLCKAALRRLSARNRKLTPTVNKALMAALRQAEAQAQPSP